MLFLLVGFALHAFLFYLFKVVHPPSKRLLSQPAGITLLTKDDPAAIPLLQELADRNPTFEGSLAEVEAVGPGTAFVADYVASFRDYQPQLRSPEAPISGSSPSSTLSVPSLSSPGLVYLPTRRPKAASEGPIDRKIALPQWKLGGGLEGRGMLVPPSLKGVDLKLLAEQDTPARLRLLVNARGKITFAGLSTFCPAELDRQLRDAVAPVRFKPLTTSSTDPDQGFLELGWEATPWKN